MLTSIDIIFFLPYNEHRAGCELEIARHQEPSPIAWYILLFKIGAKRPAVERYNEIEECLKASSSSLQRFHGEHTVPSYHLQRRGRDHTVSSPSKAKDEGSKMNIWARTHNLTHSLLLPRVCLLCRIIQHNVEENVESTEDTADFSPTLDLDEQAFIDKLMEATNENSI